MVGNSALQDRAFGYPPEAFSCVGVIPMLSACLYPTFADSYTWFLFSSIASEYKLLAFDVSTHQVFGVSLRRRLFQSS